MKTFLLLGFSFFVSQAASASLTVVADSDHAGGSARSTATSIMQSFSSAHRCVFVEVPPNFNAPMNSFMFQRASYSATVGPAIARYQNSIGYNFQNVVPEYFLSSAAQLSTRAYGIDFAEGSAMESRVRNVWRQIAPHLNHLETAPKPVLLQFVRMLEARSEIMSGNIARALRSGNCQEAVLVVGEAHLRPEILGIPMRTLQTDLSRKGISARF